MELSNIQKKIVETNKDKVVVMSAAASGKTRTLTARLSYLLEKGVEPESIAVITFTNAAAAEILERVGDKASGCFIGTIHSLANYFLSRYNIPTADIIAREEFSMLFELVDANPHCVTSFEHLLLDEAQDSNAEQFHFILDLIKPKNFMFFGDVRQSIYEFAGACPELLLNLSRQHDVTTFDMNENYRNCEEILEFAKGFISACENTPFDCSRAMRFDIGEVTTPALDYNMIIRLVENFDEYKDWFILSRTNDGIDVISRHLKNANIPYDTFKRSEVSNSELAQKLNENTVKILTIHSAKGLEAKNVICFGAFPYNEQERRLCYVAATRARDKLVWCKAGKAKKNKTKSQAIKTSSWE